MPGPASKRSIFVMVGEMSADMHAAAVIGRMRTDHPELHFFGVGGTRMEEAGVELLHNCQAFSVVGIFEVLRFLPRLKKLRSEVLAEIARRKPAAALLVDYGGFNLNLAASLSRQFPDLPIVYFISPQVWASRPWRINTIKETVTRMLTIFPFEESLYRSKGVDAKFVGHPLAERLENEKYSRDRDEACRRLGLDPDRPVVAIFPGSRRGEIHSLLPTALAAARWLGEERPQLQFALSQASLELAPTIARTMRTKGFTDSASKQLILVPPGETLTLMSAADIVWAKSGTTTLECALMGKPMLVFYKASWLSFLLFLLFKQIKHVSWPNILAARLLVPELIQLDCRPELFVRYTRDWLDVPGARDDIARALISLRSRLGSGDFAASAGGDILSIIEKQDTARAVAGT